MANKDRIIEDIYSLWISGEKEHVASALEGADEYIDEIIYMTGVDIYNSCIKDYYNQYEPTSYDRHGDLKGFNLYFAADDFAINDYEIAVGNDELDATNLLKYPGKRGRQKRHQVLKGVINGFRGSRGVSGFPMEFITSYPNQYSRCDYWTSDKSTIYDIFDDFEKNIDDDLDYMYWDYLYSNL